MQIIIPIVIVGVVIFIFHGDLLLEKKCPVCGSRRYWTRRYWGSDKYYDEEFCANCYRALYDLKTGEMKTYDTPQDWLG